MNTFVSDVQTVPASEVELFRFNNPAQGFLTMQNAGMNNVTYSLQQSSDGGLNWGQLGCSCGGQSATPPYPYVGVLVPVPSPQAYVGIPIQTNASLIRVMGSGNSAIQFGLTRQVVRQDFGPIPAY